MDPRALIATAAAIIAILAVMLVALPDGSAPPQGSTQKPALTQGQREVRRALVVGLGAEYAQVTCRPGGWEYHCTRNVTCALDEDRPLPQGGGNANYITCFGDDTDSPGGFVGMICVIDTGDYMSLRDPGEGSCVP